MKAKITIENKNNSNKDNRSKNEEIHSNNQAKPSKKAK